MLLYRLFGSALILRVAKLYNIGTMTSSMNQCNTVTRYLNQSEAAALDQDLFTEYKFSVDQLMELAGLSVASAIAKVFPPSTHSSALIVCGPGNNGGDGLVAARHMQLFGYNVSVHYPKRTPKPLYENLLEQCIRFNVNIIDKLPDTKDLNNEYKVLVDALFGFSFKPPVREELKPALDALIDSNLPVCSVDIPSGWDVEKGPGEGRALKPALLISLSAPKLCAKPEFLRNTKHYLGGRFLPTDILKKYNLEIPQYPDQEQIVKLSC
ncbi:NAD(P)H-hydrate epimerase [Bombyx mandarina]|uniref:NAD(P)H-hydrate epimerase n=2 Tax=Bombyx TaxID=7090 RepID=A0A8R1WFV6_BOMMO|nr:NAD(P)H-hydrate epimerase [Bombyx mori]XP_028026379.1 NAD(P)H-hydrate epimerase [Bombyx mandarina]